MMVATHHCYPDELYDYTLLNLVLDFINDKSFSYPIRLESGMRACDFVTVFHYMKNSAYFNAMLALLFLRVYGNMVIILMKK
jgi:hypothetical protein